MSLLPSGSATVRSATTARVSRVAPPLRSRITGGVDRLGAHAGARVRLAMEEAERREAIVVGGGVLGRAAVVDGQHA